MNHFNLCFEIFDETQGRLETYWNPGQANNSAPLQADNFLNVSVCDRADEIFEDACPKLWIIFGDFFFFHVDS